MFRKEIMILASSVATVILLVTLFAVAAGHLLLRNASLIATDNVPGLVSAGTALSHIQDNWLRVNQLPDLSSDADRLALIQQIRTNSPDQLWLTYRQAIFDKDEQNIFNQMASARSNYVALREEYFAQIQAGHLVEARVLLKSNLVSQFEPYRISAIKLFAFDTKSGLMRSSQAIWFYRAFLILFILLCIFIFAVGFFVGLRLALGGSSPFWRSGHDQSRSFHL